MTDAILARRFTTHLGGNIGRSLLQTLPEIAPDHLVVLELSSFQLEDVPLVGISPHIAVVTNLLPNHLDRHGTMEAYAAAKKNIFAFQTSHDVLILNAACEATADWRGQAPGQTEWFDPADEPFELSVPGRHNQANAQAGWAAGRRLGVDRETAADALRGFPGLPHRLKLILDRDGVRYYDDSKCTTPEGAVTALDAFDPRSAVILLGGYDAGVSFEALGEAVGRRAKAAIVLGATREKIAAAVEAHRTGELPLLERAGSLSDAVRLSRELASDGDVVLLSPACASYDMFNNYEERGDAFVKLVGG
jgi:UDP-N-acetylmuramoylalanine--D-glutamate ligase